jgi:glycosyltransferase involved in cell wall biosynthesis
MRGSSVNSRPSYFDVIFVSYESGDFRNCPAEWADDKVMSLVRMGKKVALVTSYASSLESSERLKVFKVLSISKRDFEDEIARRKLHAGAVDKLPFGSRFISGTFGRLFDSAFRFLAGADSWGRYSWVLSALPIIAKLIILNPSAALVASGGPSSSQVSITLASSLVTRRRPILEFQDPFIGSEMALSSRARRVLESLEAWLVERASKIVMVTDGAANEMRSRHLANAEKILRIYPGSPRFEVSATEFAPGNGQFEIVHLGTLYGTRNLDLVFEALDNIYQKKPDVRGKIKVRNLGNIHLDNTDDYLARADFVHDEPLPRQLALAQAAKSGALLLIQHKDSRSRETIPYKTYDYLNLNLPIVGILNNPELAELCVRAGGVAASATSVDEIEKALLLVFESAITQRDSVQEVVGSMEKQLLELLS